MYRSKNFSATKYDMIDLSLNVIDAAIGDATASGSSTEWAMRSFFGRINLDWENKYLLEVNLRADQSSRFLSNNRTGYFPSASVAWRMDQEAFMEDWVEKGLSNLKMCIRDRPQKSHSCWSYSKIRFPDTRNSREPDNRHSFLPVLHGRARFGTDGKGHRKEYRPCLLYTSH